MLYPAFILGFTGLALVWPGALDSLNNPGAHGFSEILYAYTTGTMNNGSAFEGLADDTYFYNTTVGLVMLFGRYLPVRAPGRRRISCGQERIPETAGTFSTATPIFAAVLVATIVLVGGLTFFPSWALGPLAEEFQMLAGKTFLLGGRPWKQERTTHRPSLLRPTLVSTALFILVNGSRLPAPDNRCGPDPLPEPGPGQPDRARREDGRFVPDRTAVHRSPHTSIHVQA